MKPEKHPSLYEYRRHLDVHRKTVERAIKTLVGARRPETVYAPIRHVMSGGGKRLRSVLAMLACEAAGGLPSSAVPAAVAVELLHNFTLVHDDVMDHAPLRRGRPTVHEAWDTNTAILAGDEMIALAYRSLTACDANQLPELLRLFTDAFVKVCEGQGFDKEFENRIRVDIDEYDDMIRLKTACIISAAAEIGATIGGADFPERTAFRSFGEHLGIAFQINDDLLDITGSEEKFGKQIGGDIVEHKKTFLLVHALNRARGNQLHLVRRIAHGGKVSRATIEAVRSVYESTGVLNDARRMVIRHTRLAARALNNVPPSRATETLRWLANRLAVRTQ